MGLETEYDIPVLTTSVEKMVQWARRSAICRLNWRCGDRGNCGRRRCLRGRGIRESRLGLNWGRDGRRCVRVGTAAAPQGNTTDDGNASAADGYAHHELARGHEPAALGPMVDIVVSLHIHRDTGAYVISLLEEFCLEGIELTLGSDLAAWVGSGRVRGERAAVGLGSHLIALNVRFGASLERTDPRDEHSKVDF